MGKNYDIVSIGHVTHDIRNMMGNKTYFTGGAAYFSPFAARRSGAKILVITKMAKEHQENLESLKKVGVDIICYDSPKTTSIENIFVTQDQDKRKLELLSQADLFTINDVPKDIKGKVMHVATLFRGEMPDDMLPELAKRGKVALDLQSALRIINGKEISFQDWADKEKYLQYAYFIKADSLETKAITELDDREEAARLIYAWAKGGKKEIIVTRKDEVLVFDGKKFYRAPFTAKNLEGRAGRGDTCFLSYITRRLKHSIEDSVHYAAALTSIKMEAPKPFDGTVKDVLKRMKDQPY